MIKLADFGSANTKDRVKSDAMCGTPEYLSPEMISKQGYDEKIDVWALGILLYEMKYTKTPFVAFLAPDPRNLGPNTTKTEQFNKLTDAILVDHLID